MLRSMCGFKAQYDDLTLLVISEFNEWKVLLYAPGRILEQLLVWYLDQFDHCGRQWLEALAGLTRHDRNGRAGVMQHRGAAVTREWRPLRRDGNLARSLGVPNQLPTRRNGLGGG